MTGYQAQQSKLKVSLPPLPMNWSKTLLNTYSVFHLIYSSALTMYFNKKYARLTRKPQQAISTCFRAVVAKLVKALKNVKYTAQCQV